MIGYIFIFAVYFIHRIYLNVISFETSSSSPTFYLYTHYLFSNKIKIQHKRTSFTLKLKSRECKWQKPEILIEIQRHCNPPLEFWYSISILSQVLYKWIDRFTLASNLIFRENSWCFRLKSSNQFGVIENKMAKCVIMSEKRKLL